MKPASVIILNDFCHVQGGASQVALDEAIGLAELGVSVSFLGAAGPVDPALARAGVRVICLDQPALSGAPLGGRAASLALWNGPARSAMRRLLDGLDRSSTIVHLHGYTKALTATPVVAAHGAGFTAICTLHDFFSACPNGAFYDYRRQAPCPLPPLGVRCVLRHCDKRRATHKAYRVVRGATQRWVGGFPAIVRDYISLSRRSAEILRPHLPADARLWPLDNPVDVARAPPVDVAANRPLAVIGRLEAEKGVVLAAEAARLVGLPITFVGDGELRTEVEKLGGVVTGWLPRAGVLAVLESARCLVFASRWYETHGLAVAEAAARGVPAIVSDISAPAERIVPDETGWVFRSGDLHDLAVALRATQSDASLRAAGRAAYDRFWARPADRAHHVRDLLGIYETVLGREAGR
jgi:glycosyltransferase involved in cell wall biosynthesis